MQITHRLHRNVDVLDINGQFTFGARKEFVAAMEKMKQKNSPHVMLNFKQVTFIDSAAIGLLALAAQESKSGHRKLSVIAAQGTVNQVLALAHIDQMVPMFMNEDAALSAKAA